MKRFVLFIFLCLLLIPANVFAKQNENQGINARPTAKITIQAQKQEENRTQKREQKKENIRKYFTQMNERMESLIKRLDELVLRLESRIAKMKSEGAQVKDVENQLKTIELKLAEVKNSLPLIQAKFEEILTSANPKESFKDAKILIADLKTQLKEIHKLLVHLIGDVKGLRVGTEKLTPKPTKDTTND